MSIPVLQGKRRGPTPTGQTPVTALRLSEELRAAIDRAITDLGIEMNRSEFIRGVLAQHLKAGGYLKAATFSERYPSLKAMAESGRAKRVEDEG